jgi:hypothetical protein
MQNSPPPGDQPAAPQGGAQEGADDQERAARVTTVTLIVTLVFVVVITGVLATVAVLMTRNPDAPLLSTVAVRRLQTPMHFAPVTAVRQAPCPGAEAVLDDAGATCYEVAPGVTVTTVQKIETLKEKSGTYAVRVVLSPDSRDKITALTRDTVKKQIAIVVGDRVVTAPRVAQTITEDSLSIAGFTKDAADALVARLIGSPAGVPTGPVTAPVSPPVSLPPTQVPTGGAASAPTATGGAASAPTATGGVAAAPTATGPATQPTVAHSVRSTASPGTGPSGGAGLDPRFPTCKEAHAHGYGPYTKGRHPEYTWYTDKDHDGVACDRQDL